MLKNVSIGGKLLVGICSTMVITFAVYTTVIVNKTTDIAIHDATQLAVQMAGTHGNHVQNSIEKALDASKATAAAFVSFSKHKDAVDRDITDDIIWEVTMSDPTFYGTQVVFEPNALDGNDSRHAGTREWYGKNGRYGPYFWKGEGGQKLAVDLIQYEPEKTRAWYKKPRDTRKPVLTEPYYSDVAETTMATVSVPMISGGKFLGIVGIDFTLTEFQQMVEDITPMGNGYAMVASNQGFCVAHPDEEMLTKNIADAFPDAVRSDLLSAVKNGKRWVRQLPSVKNGGQEFLYVFEPINVQGTDTPWTIGIAIPMAQITKEAGAFLNLSIILSVAAIGIILVVVLLIVRSLTRPIGIMLSSAQAVSKGDFNAVPDESHFSGELLKLHRALGEMVGNLIGYIETAKQKTEEAEKQSLEAERLARETETALENAKRARHEGMVHAAEQLETIASRVSNASENIFARINEANSGADIQRQRSTETATAMEEMNASVLEVARGAGSAADSAEEARKNADEGAAIVTSVVDAISRVHEETGRLESGLNELGEQAEGIGTIMNVITDIADQTNLLALNAAIEAARAGDAGRGFAVVADEVRKLAEKTMQATKKVGQAVTAIQTGTRNNIDGMQETARTVNDATELARKAGDALRSIMAIVDSTADQVRNIATASEQQSSASEEINRGTEEINQVASETAQSMAQATEAVRELGQLSERMNQLIVDLKRDTLTE